MAVTAAGRSVSSVGEPASLIRAQSKRIQRQDSSVIPAASYNTLQAMAPLGLCFLTP